MPFKYKTFLIFLTLLVATAPSLVSAATLNFSPSTLTRAVGNIFTVQVYVSSSDRAMNASSGIISFPQDKLEVVSISKSGSIISLWAQEPTFSNVSGTANFEGIALNPGFIGSNGTVISITFRAKAVGQADVRFSSGSVLANDGAGTNILTSMSSANFVITESEIGEIPVQPTVSGEISITSSSHSDQSRWYANSTPEFSWTLPEGAVEAKTVIGSQNAVPSVLYSPPISSKKVDVLPDGTYYFGLQVRTSEGWGSVSRYRVNIDTVPPNPFSIIFPYGNDGFESEKSIIFSTTDSASGVSKYEVSVNGEKSELVVPPSSNNPYVIPMQYPGNYTVMVTAFDEAGNTRSASAEFVVEGIDAPVITEYDKEIELGGGIAVKGTTYPNSEVIIYIKQDGKVVAEKRSRSNSLGNFSAVVDQDLYRGEYIITARSINDRGEISYESEHLPVLVKSKLLTGIVGTVLNYISAVMVVIIGLATVILAGSYIWNKTVKVLINLKKEGKEAEETLEKSFKSLKEDIADHINRLKSLKRRLTKEELEFLEKFEKKIKEAEEDIVKEIKDIYNP